MKKKNNTEFSERMKEMGEAEGRRTGPSIIKRTKRLEGACLIIAMIGFSRSLPK